MSSFALEVVSIFVSTVTGTVLLSHGEQVAKKAIGYVAPLELLHHHHEFEYLTIQIGFLQGLFNWLVAVALEQIIPKENETKSAQRMNKCMAACIMTLCIWIQGFYNHQWVYKRRQTGHGKSKHWFYNPPGDFLILLSLPSNQSIQFSPVSASIQITLTFWKDIPFFSWRDMSSVGQSGLLLFCTFRQR